MVVGSAIMTVNSGRRRARWDEAEGDDAEEEGRNEMRWRVAEEGAEPAEDERVKAGRRRCDARWADKEEGAGRGEAEVAGWTKKMGWRLPCGPTLTVINGVRKPSIPNISIPSTKQKIGMFYP